MNDVAQDLRYALRRLALTPGFTLLALVTLALGIGANTALYSVLYAVLLKPLPFSEPERLYWVYSRHTSTDRYPFSLPGTSSAGPSVRPSAAVTPSSLKRLAETRSPGIRSVCSSLSRFPLQFVKPATPSSVRVRSR